ncbi:glycoside hydrolase family 9 protein [Pseudobacteroides cellulosolvens]|nr:glycoside hydrolase family 9 protein [Pseudobacteroides cellulosolvens]
MKRIFYYLMSVIFVFGSIPSIQSAATASFNYGEALQKSILFYEAQRSGYLSKSDIPTRIVWRSDAQTTDGQDVGLDLTGGWVDAGDNMKYNITNSAAATLMAWSAIEYRQAYEKSGQLKWLMNQLKWINDFFIKCHPEPNVFYGQIGMTKSDHDNWIPIESSQFITDRKAIKMDPQNPATDLVLEVAAAMAASSMVFRPTDPSYADTLLSHAEQLFAFGDKYRGTYFDAVKKIDAATPYQSWSGINDELVWGPAWIYRAKEAKEPGSGSSYIAKAEANYSGLGNEKDQKVHKYKWTHNYDDATFGSYVLMSQLKPDNADYRSDAERWLNWWTIGGTEHGADGTKVKYTPGGHARLDEWGSLRYAANTSILAFIYSDKLTDIAKKARYHDFAVGQINYILGQNPRESSYLIGFGDNYPKHPHHRSAHGAWGRKDDTPSEHRHILYGALVGSPTTSDGFNDSITDYVANEVDVDYNAGIVGAFARMYQEFGGTPIPDSSFPLPDKAHTAKDEWPIFVKTYWQGQGGIQLSFTVENRSGWPTRPSNKLMARYFFTLDAADPSDISISLGSGTAGPKITPKIYGPTLWDASKKVYYVTVDLTGEWIFPGYMWSFGGPEVILNINSKSNNWVSSNDWSYQDWDSSYVSGDRKYAPNMPMYEDNIKLQGNEPSDGPSNTPVPTATPTNPSGGYKISGYISPDFAVTQSAVSLVKSNFSVDIMGLSAKTDSAGYFEINNVPSNTEGAVLKISKPGFLAMEKNIKITSNMILSKETSPIYIWAGDISKNGVQDGAINMSDIIELAKGFNSIKGDLKYSSEYDFNQDNSVNMNDVIIIAKHFNAVSASYFLIMT